MSSECDCGMTNCGGGKGINADACHSFERGNLKLCTYKKYSKNNIENTPNRLVFRIPVQ